MTNCEMLPMADPNFEPGPPSDDSIELARVGYSWKWIGRIG